MKIDRDHPLNVIAWRDGCLAAWDLLGERFTEETGISLAAASSAIGGWIDQETGFADGKKEAFVEWWTIEVWGRDMAPSSYLEHLDKNGSALGRYGSER